MGVAERFPDPAVQKSMEVDLALIAYYEPLLRDLELPIVKAAQQHDPHTLYLLQTVPGIGKILSLVLLYEIHDISVSPACRISSPIAASSSVPKNQRANVMGPQGPRSAMRYLTWAFSEAAVLFLRNNPAGQKYSDPLGEKTWQGQSVDAPGP